MHASLAFFFAAKLGSDSNGWKADRVSVGYMRHDSVCSACGGTAHITKEQFDKVQAESGEDWLPHYIMLHSAEAGCVRSLEMYVDGGGCTVNGKKLTVWDSAQFKTQYNAYRATCQKYYEKLPGGQEKCRQYLRCLPGARKRLTEMQRDFVKRSYSLIRSGLSSPSFVSEIEMCLYVDLRALEFEEETVENKATSSRADGADKP